MLYNVKYYINKYIVMIWELVENIYDLIKIKENDKNGFKFFY